MQEIKKLSESPTRASLDFQKNDKYVWKRPKSHSPMTWVVWNSMKISSIPQRNFIRRIREKNVQKITLVPNLRSTILKFFINVFVPLGFVGIFRVFYLRFHLTVRILKLSLPYKDFVYKKPPEIFTSFRFGIFFRKFSNCWTHRIFLRTLGIFLAFFPDSI